MRPLSQESRIIGPTNFDFESFKKEILKEIEDKTWKMIRDMITEMVEKMPLGEEEFKTRTIVGEPFKEKLKASVDPTESKWMENTQRQMDQL